MNVNEKPTQRPATTKQSNYNSNHEFFYSGFEPRVCYDMSGIITDERYNGNAAEIALAYYVRHSILLSIEADILFAQFADSDKKFIADLSDVYARDLVSALALFFYVHILSRKHEFVIKEFAVVARYLRPSIGNLEQNTAIL